jgi:hypothetical protein
MRMQNYRQTNKILTLVTCWYIVKSKFNVTTYMSWITNLISIVNNFNLVIYTDLEGYKMLYTIPGITNNKIRIVLKSFENFYTYKYKEKWINNHNNSIMDLHKRTDWHLNMIWNEKPFFVQDAYRHMYFDTIFYAWCDIGYFRNDSDHLLPQFLKLWPNTGKLFNSPFTNMSIHYGCIQNDITIIDRLLNTNNKLEDHTPCFAGGFFLLPKELINYYAKIYADKLEYYFANDYFIKDDQTIITDLILNNPNVFYIHYDLTKSHNWFMFQKILL